MGAVTRWSCLTAASVSLGTRRLVLAVSILVLGMLALAARADAFVYWANFGNGTIGRANLNGSHVNQSFITGASAPIGVAVDGLPATCDGSGATIAGTGRADKLRGTDDDDVIAAKGGDDTVVGLRGDDLVCGGAGADLLRGQGGDDTLSGGRGKDELRGGGGSNRCRGGRGSDSKHQC